MRSYGAMPRGTCRCPRRSTRIPHRRAAFSRQLSAVRHPATRLLGRSRKTVHLEGWWRQTPEAELRSAWTDEGVRPSTRLRLRLLVLVEGIQEAVNLLFRHVVGRGQTQLVRVGSADANFL